MAGSAPLMPAIPIAQVRVFLADIERIPSRVTQNHTECLLVEPVQVLSRVPEASTYLGPAPTLPEGRGASPVARFDVLRHRQPANWAPEYESELGSPSATNGP